MKKQDFLLKLKDELLGLPSKEVNDRINFYAEMIDDRIEDGFSEEQAVEQIGTVESVAQQILVEIPLSKIVKERITPSRKLKTWEIVLLALGSPIWLALLISAFAVAISLYAVLWSLVVCTWAVFVSFCAGVVGGVLGGPVIMIFTNAPSGFVLIGCGLLCGGLAIFTFYGCKFVDVGTAKLTKKIVVGVKNAIVKKEVA